MRLAIFSLLLLPFMLARPASGQQGYSIALSKEDKVKIKEGVQAMHDAMLEGDVDVILAKTYPRLIQFSGGEEIFKKSVREAIEILKTNGMKFESYEIGEPSEMFLAGSEWICFIPETSVAVIKDDRSKDRRFRSTGFAIGVKGGTSTKWRFLEGIHLKKDPEALWRLFPDLSRRVKLPPIKQELLEDKPGIRG